MRNISVFRHTRRMTLIALLLIAIVGQALAGTFTSNGSTHLYFNKTQKNNSGTSMDFSVDNAVLWVYMRGGTAGEQWYKASHVSGDVWAVVTSVSGTYTKCIIIRKQPGQADSDKGNWNNKWDQTADIDIDNNRNYRLQDSWSSYGSPSLVGQFNNWNPASNPLSEGWTSVYLAAGVTKTFKVLAGTSWYGNNGTISSSQKEWVFETSQGNCTITSSVAGTYYFNWDATNKRLTVIYPDLAAKKELTKNKYIYFNATDAATTDGGWRTAAFNARFWFKYYDTGTDQGSVDCTGAAALEDYVYYALVPNEDKIGRIQLNRINPANTSEVWCVADAAYAYERTNGDENCLTMESGKENYCKDWRPQWTYYCPPMSSVTLIDNGTTLNWGGDGSSANPYIIPAGSTIKVRASSTSALADNNMTAYYQFKYNGTPYAAEATWVTRSITASGVNKSKRAVTVVASNHYSSAVGTAMESDSIFYETRTAYTISYDAGSDGSGSRDSETKLNDIDFTLPATAVFTRDYYTQTGWTTSDGGAQTHSLGGTYTGNTAQTFSPVWSENPYTVAASATAGGSVGAASYTAYVSTTTAISAVPAAGYKFSHWEVLSGDVSIYNVNAASTTITATSAGSIKAHFTYRWSVAGSWLTLPESSSWDSETYMLTNVGTNAAGDDTCSVVVTLAAKTSYRFTIVNHGYQGSAKQWYGHGTESATVYWSTDDFPWTFGYGEGNKASCGLVSTVAGDYKFVWNITDNTLDAVVYPENHRITFTDATGNHLWSTVANWEWGLPDMTDTVYIQKPVTVDITTAKAYRVVIDQSSSHTGQLTVQDGKALIVATTVKKTTDGVNLTATEASDIYIASSSTGNGSLVMGSHDGTNYATVDFYTKAHKTSETNWVNQYIGTPFSMGQGVKADYYGSYLYSFDVTGQAWVNIKDEDYHFTPFLGYNILRKDAAATTLNMQGKLVATSNQSPTLGYNGSRTENMLANSWTAPIKINAFNSYSAFTNVEASIYIFNAGGPEDAEAGTAGNYTTYTVGSAGDNDVIPSMQAFSVYASNSGPAITLNYTKLVYEPAVNDGVTVRPNYAPRRAKAAEVAEEMEQIRLRVTGTSGYADELKIYLHEDFSCEFENGWDGHKMYGYPETPQLYAVTEDGELAILCAPDAEGTLLGFKAGEADTEYTFSFRYLSDDPLYLLDVQTNIYTDMRTGSTYTFQTTDLGAHNRFLLTRQAPTMPTGLDGVGEDTQARKFIDGNKMYILLRGVLYDATGKRITTLP